MNKYKSVFISDLHIGSSHSQIEKALKFLKESEFENLFLVGDIIDGWLLEKRFHWPRQANIFLQKILRLSRKNVNITYLPGNHDSFLDEFEDSDFGGIKIKKQVEYQSVKEGKILVLHGHQFDGIISFCPRLQKIGAYFYEISIFINFLFKLIGIKWSFSSFLKRKAKEAVKFVSSYKNALVSYCFDNDCQGVILGHLHWPEISHSSGIKYYNIGDLVESNTVLVETMDGDFKIIEL